MAKILYEVKQNLNTYTSAYGKYFARVEYKKTMSIDDMAKHMAEHNTPFSVGTIAGILNVKNQMIFVFLLAYSYLCHIITKN